MKIAVSAKAQNIDSMIDQRFGRASYFAIYDLEEKSYHFIENKQNAEASQGAGIQTAQNVVKFNAQCVITGNCGPKAFRALKEANVKIYLCQENISIRQAIENFTAGKLTEVNAANVDGHWN